jgi:TonB family protein
VPKWERGGFICEHDHFGSQAPPKPVILSFSVEPDGSVEDIAVVRSSGEPATDKDAVHCLGERHYVPAKQDGTPVEVHISDWVYRAEFGLYRATCSTANCATACPNQGTMGISR